MFKRLRIQPTALFLLPATAVIALLALLSTGCETGRQEAAGSVKLLYTSEVGGRLDPCG